MAEIGKNIIENLTTAMYENSYMIYREYIQNAADSIDKAINYGILNKDDAYININIERNSIKIFDNAMGIKAKDFYNTLSNIADSQKDRRKEKGFRGIGRLAGLAYCDKLIFRTSYKNENLESIMEWDGSLLREILNNSKERISASALVDKLIKHSVKKLNKKEDIEEHFFEVELQGILDENKSLVDINKIKKYLEFVAPVPYRNHFNFKEKIYQFVKENNLKLDEYDISINGKELFKPYRNDLFKGEPKKIYDSIIDLYFKKIISYNGELLGWLWIGVTRYDGKIPVINEMRSIRLRKDNIQIGNESTIGFPEFFKEERGGSYFIGEIFAVSENLIPNARRDYFNKNATLKIFEEEIKKFTYDELYKLYYYANKVKNTYKKYNDIIDSKNKFETKLLNSDFVDSNDFKKEEEELKKSEKELEKINGEIDKLKNKQIGDCLQKRVFNLIQKNSIKENTNNVDNINNSKLLEANDVVHKKRKNKIRYKTQQLSRYNKREQKLISKIYTKIKQVLPLDMAENLIEKIQDDLQGE